MRKRRSAVVVVIAVVLALAWWRSAEPEAAEPTAPAPMVMLEAPVDAAVVPAVSADAPADAGALTARKEDARRPLVSTWHLGEGNTIADLSGSKNEFQRACQKEAEVCARRLGLDGLAENPVLVAIGGEAGSRRVTGYSSFMEVVGAPTPFTDCVLAGLSTHTFIDPQIEADQYSCSSDGEPPERELVRAAAKCVGPGSKAEVVTITPDADGTPRVSALGRLDLSAEACIRQAALTAGAPQERVLQLVLAGDIGGPIPDEDARRLEQTTQRTTPRVPPTPEALAQADEHRRLAEVALASGNAKEAVRQPRECLSVDTDNVDCLRGSALAWLEYLRDNPGKTSVTAATIWVRFATEMPPDDPDMAKVEAALARMGVHLR